MNKFTLKMLGGLLYKLVFSWIVGFGAGLKDDRAFSLLHQELPQIFVLCFP